MDVQTQTDTSTSKSEHNSTSEAGWNWNRGCKVCGKRGDLKKCTRCNKIYYCSEECQKLDFKQHKKICQESDHALILLPKEDPKDPCPICLSEECDEGIFVTCYQCGSSFCGNCITSKTLLTVKSCPMCRYAETFTNEKKLECLEKLLQRGVSVERVYPTMALVKMDQNPSDPTITVYLARALERGAHYAGSKLADVLEDQGGDKDMIFELHQQAASHRIYLSQVWLADYYLSEGDKSLEFHWHTRAYENGSLKSTIWLAEHYLPLDEQRSIDLYKQAGDFGCNQSIFTYARLMEKRGDKREAHENYAKCMLYIPEAYYRLGEMYSLGYPATCHRSAVVMYIAGASVGSIDCVIKLGLIYLSFSGFNPEISPEDISGLKRTLLEKDPDYEQKFIQTGLEYLGQAVKLGSSKASNLLGDYYLTIKKYDRTIEMYQKAFELGDPEAYVSIARIYVSDYIDQKDTPKALSYLGRALESGSRQAAQVLKTIMKKVGQLSNDLSSVS